MDEIPAFHVQPLLSELYHSRDLLDLSTPGELDGHNLPPLADLETEAGPSAPAHIASPPAPSLFASATSIAAAAGRRAAAAAGASPILASTAQIAAAPSFDRSPASNRDEAGRREVRCVEGYGQNLYIGRSDGVVEWWVCDAAHIGSSEVCRLCT
jgi:hypothetical protein